jgi:NADPH:quinone reductase-like Zn-dependent oxidoreductase
MKGVIVAKAGGLFEVTDTLERPKPGPKEILVKSLAAGINPMYAIPNSKTLPC